MAPCNALWSLFSARRERLLAEQRDYPWRQENASTVIQQLYETCRATAVVMPYTAEDLNREVLVAMVMWFLVRRSCRR